MKNSLVVGLLPILALPTLPVLCNLAQASDYTSTTQADAGSMSSWGDLESKPWRVYGGAATGYNNVSGSEYNKAADGPAVTLDADLSFQTPRWVFETGAGWTYSRLDGEGTPGTSISVRTRSAFADASARYRLGQHWQVGPAYNLEFGTDDHFGSSVGNSRALSLLGARVDYEFPLGGFPFRVILEGLNSVGAGDRNYFVTTLGFQVGLPFGHKTQEAPVVAETQTITTSSAAPVRSNDVRITLAGEKIFFGTNSDQIRPSVKKALGDIGSFLASNEQTWGTLEVNGYADQRGTVEHNLELSRKRSDAVRSVFAADGADPKKMEVIGFGKTHLLDERNVPSAWSKNRRVELVFHDVADPQALEKKISGLMKYEVPGAQK